MTTCIGFVRARNEASAWKPCGKPSLEGDRMCCKHRDALDSTLLGLMAWEQREAEEKSRQKRSSPLVGHAQRCGGKSRRPSGSNRTRQACVPLPPILGAVLSGECIEERSSEHRTEAAEIEEANSKSIEVETETPASGEYCEIGIGRQ